MRAVALGQILISYFHTLKAQMSELPLSSRCVNEKMTTSIHKTTARFSNHTRTAYINGAC